jgi:hypothetical protein
VADTFELLTSLERCVSGIFLMERLKTHLFQLRFLALELEYRVVEALVVQEPSIKLREDVEAEWLPKVQKLEARAKERETFYKSLYDSVLELKRSHSPL